MKFYSKDMLISTYVEIEIKNTFLLRNNLNSYTIFFFFFNHVVFIFLQRFEPLN